MVAASLVAFSACTERESGEARGPADVSPETPTQLEQSNGQVRERRQAAAGDLGARLEDSRLTSRVLLALADDDHLGRYAFEAEAVDGRVYVRGSVPTVGDRQRIETVVGGVGGVRSVVNETTSDEPLPESPPIAAEDAELDPDEPVVAREEPAPAPEEPAETAPASETHHTVRSGESLWTIARQYNTSIAEIRRLNNMSSDNLRPGQRIRVQ
jgi:LysM repeat protein